MIFIDIETFSTVDLRKFGVFKYAEHSKILLFQYAINDGAIHVLDIANGDILPTFSKDEIIVAHNTIFDKTVLKYHNWTNAFTNTWVCTKTIANALAIPSSLKNICAYLNIQKNEEIKVTGKKLIELFSIPQKNNIAVSVFNFLKKHKEKGSYITGSISIPKKFRNEPAFKNLTKLTIDLNSLNNLINHYEEELKTPLVYSKNTHHKEWELFKKYAGNDIEILRLLYKSLPSWVYNAQVKKIYNVDSVINETGFLIDTELCNYAVNADIKYRKTTEDNLKKLTNGVVSTGKQIKVMLDFIHENFGFYEFNDLSAHTVKTFIDIVERSGFIKNKAQLLELLKIRQSLSSSSVAKYKTASLSVNSDNRLRGAFIALGAKRTGRWSGSLFQPQNLPRPELINKDIDSFRKIIRATDNLHYFGNTKKILKSLIRSIVVAPKNCSFVSYDWNAIECRTLAYLANEKWKVDAYKNYDLGIGEELYKLTYANVFNVDINTVNKEQRTLGKILELGLGYGGGIGVLVVFSENYNLDLKKLAFDYLSEISVEYKIQALGYYEYCIKNNINISETRDKDVFIFCDAVKRMWRVKNKNIENFWYDCENAFKLAIILKEQITVGKLTFSYIDNFLRIALPSGRYLCYPNPIILGDIEKKIIKNRIRVTGTITYEGADTSTKNKWGKIYTRGSKIVENINQGFCVDILANALTKLTKKGLKVVLHVHDEIVVESNDNAIQETKKIMENVMRTPPDYAENLPLNVSGTVSSYYRK